MKNCINFIKYHEICRVWDVFLSSYPSQRLSIFYQKIMLILNYSYTLTKCKHLTLHFIDNSHAADPVFITTKISRFHLKQGSSTPNNLMGRVKTMWAPCLFRGRTPVPLKKVANGDIWFFTERDWSQGCCHGNNIVGVILFLFWCTFLVPSLKITAQIFLEIF